MATATKDGDIETLRKDVEELSDAVKTLTSDLKNTARANGESFVNRAGDKFHAYSEDAQAMAKRVADRSRETADTAAGVVRERPLQSMLVAFGVGLVVAKLLDRR